MPTTAMPVGSSDPVEASVADPPVDPELDEPSVADVFVGVEDVPGGDATVIV